MNLEMSDLFFNHQHSNFDAVFQDAANGITQEEIYEAILEDAQEFVSHYPLLTQGITAREFAVDFMKRL